MKKPNPTFPLTRLSLALTALSVGSTALAQDALQPLDTGAESHGTLDALVVEGESNEETSPILYDVESSSAALFTDTPLIETPFSVSVYDQRLIEDQRAFTLQDVLENDPSVSIQMPGGFYGVQNFGLRGFRVDNFNGYRLDGLPVMNTVAPYLDDKSRVELLKGPAALRFGFMPPGGAINLVRKHPTQEFSTSIQADVDSFGRVYSQLDVSDTVADGAFGYRLVLAGEEFDSFYDNADGERWLGSLYTEWNPSDNLKVWSSFGVQNLNRTGYYGPMVSSSGLILDTGVETNIMQDWARNKQDVFDAAIGTDIDFNDDWKLRASVNYQNSDRESLLTYPYSVQNNGNFEEAAFLSVNGPINWESVGGHIHLEGNFDTGSIRHQVVVGADYRAYDTFGQRSSFSYMGPNNAFVLAPQPIPAPGRIQTINFEYQEYGIFLTDTIEFNECWSALIGTRYGAYENTYPGYPADGDNVHDWSPVLALMYEPIRNVHTYATYTRGLQDGGFARRGATNAFQPLGVQESEQFELGVKTEWCDGRFASELAIFQIDQDLALLGPTGIDAFDGLQRHRGVELSLRGQLTDTLQAGISTMLLDAEQVDTGDFATDGKRPQYVPEYQVNAWSVLDIPAVPGLALTAGVRFVDGQYLDQMEQFEIDGYSVVDLGARYRFQTDNADWTLRLNLENVLDNRYFESGEFYPGDAGYLAYGAPIGANFSVQVEF
ncbi:TonB-dependent siderophore receptor [Haloferula chungangensis]|uniref:TonB-dependent siderophore receptor n=1 Tax=Haloferula chungangensis TaxID=1048331 RepID=A0ABW2L9G7_9BACT